MSLATLSADLHSILNSFLDLVGCDGGSIYTLEKNLKGEPVLVFKAMVTRSLNISSVPDELKSAVFRLDEKSLVGKTGYRQKVFNENFDLIAKTTTDETIKYHTRNILSAPLLTPRGDLVGVVQLVNKIPDDGEFFANFDLRDERLCAIVSGQAALAIENSTLLVEQEKILDGFVNACVTAIEARDPVTAGHSQRVCDLTLSLANSVNRVDVGTFGAVSFNELQLREIRYSAMLHDIGKISVREDVLKKEKKLYPWEMSLIEMRFKMMRMGLKQQHSAPQDSFELAQRLKELDQAYQMILIANEPSVLPQDVSEHLLALTRLQVPIDGKEVCCALHAHENKRLSIKRGSLTSQERVEIEKHVSFTYDVLKMVPWSRGLENVPLIAHRHHEKLDGSGYPMGVPAAEIPVQSRMLTICDIYDALTAKDRPYKPAVPLEKALAILEDEVKHGKLDAVLLKLFIESKAYVIPSLPAQSPNRKIA